VKDLALTPNALDDLESGGSTFDVVRFSTSHRRQWEGLVRQSTNGTLFHTRSFLEYHPAERFQDHSLVFSKGSNFVAVLPATITQSEPGPVLCSHPGSSFGGLALSPSISMNETDGIISSLVRYCREQGLVAVEMTLAPPIYSSPPNQELEFLLYRHGFQYVSRGLAQIVSLRSHPARKPSAQSPPVRQASAEFKRKVRRAEGMGVEVVGSDDLPSFYKILEQNLAQRHGAKPTHSLTELSDLERRLPNRLRLYVAFLGDEMIAGLLAFVCNARVALAFYICFLEEYQSYRAINLLCEKTMFWFREEGLEYFDFGTSTIAMQPNWGLIQFREGAGACGFMRSRMRLELNGNG